VHVRPAWVYREYVDGEQGGRHMQAVVGDRLHVHGSVVGQPDRMGEIIEVRGVGGEPPYLVQFENGHNCLMFPGPDAVIEHQGKKARKALAKAKR
jgi:hypothetical protein